MSEPVGVLGATGYVGGAVVRSVRDHDSDVRPAAGSAHDRYPSVDVRDRDAVRSFVDGLECVVNAAGLVGIGACSESPGLAVDVNATGATNVAWACREAGVPLVHLSSVATIGEPGPFPVTADSDRCPTTVYGRTKLLGERAIESLVDDTIPAITLRLTTVYGGFDDESAGGHSVLDFFADRAAACEPLPVHRPGTQERDFVHVRDVADAIAAVIDAIGTVAPGPRSYVVGGEDAYSVLELAGLAASVRTSVDGKRPPIERREHPAPEQPLIERYDVDTTALQSDFGVTSGWTVPDWLTTTIESRLDRDRSH